MKHLISSIFLLVLVFSSCETDFDVNEEWKDNTIVYCLLNQKDSSHYIRIGKSFLGEADAYEMAQDSDSIYYNENLEVSLEKWENGALKETIPFQPSNDIVKDTGIFTTAKHKLYKSNQTLSFGGEYRLKIYIPSLDKTVSSKTHLIENFSYNQNTSTYFYFPFDFGSNTDFKIGWIAPTSARVFQATFVFHYAEVSENNLLDTSHYSISWSLPNVLSNDLEGGVEITQLVNRENFMKFVASSLKEVPYSTKRVAEKVDLILNVADDNFYVYYNVYKPTSEITQEKPLFTNIDNGIGLFASIYTKKGTWNSITDKTLDSLACGQLTKHLNFIDHNGNFHECN